MVDPSHPLMQPPIDTRVGHAELDDRMSWRDELIERICQMPCGGYGLSDSPATEPSALAALALWGEGRTADAVTVAHWLAAIQRPDGSVGVRANEPEPCWPTSLAVLVWGAADVASAAKYSCEMNQTVGRTSGPSFRGGLEVRPAEPSVDQGSSFVRERRRAIEWILKQRSVTFSREEGLGHDPGLLAWPWVEGTHAWVEPTALHVLALKSAAYGNHSRTREAVRVLLDRQLPQGGWNYGNTLVFGRELRFHVQPTSLALLALATEPNVMDRAARSLELLERNLSPQTTTASLCWACIALAAFRRALPRADEWLEAAYQRGLKRSSSPHKLALLALALQHDESRLVTLTR